MRSIRQAPRRITDSFIACTPDLPGATAVRQRPLLLAKCSAVPELAKRDTTAQSVAPNPEHCRQGRRSRADYTVGGQLQYATARSESVQSSSDAKISCPHN